MSYYPFGMSMPGRNFSSAECRHGFNGMEKDDELKGAGNSYDFGARIYDSRLGRWLVLDPVARDYPSLSDYSFVSNCPMILIDPSGKIIEPAPNLSDADAARVKSAIKKLREERPIQYAYLQSLMYHEGTNRFISSEDEDYEELKDKAIPIVIQVTIGNTDGVKAKYEASEHQTSGSKSGGTISGESKTHTEGKVKSGQFKIFGAGKGMARVKDPEGHDKSVPFTSPNQDFGEDKPSFKYVIYPLSNEGEYHFLITIDDHTGGNFGSAGDLRVLSHEGGHIEGDVIDIISAAFDQANPNYDGHNQGQTGGEIAKERETKDREKQKN